MNRRTVLLGATALLPLSACSVLRPAPLSPAYDGLYEIGVARLRVTPDANSDGTPEVPRNLATLRVRAMGGQMAIVTIEDDAMGPGYGDFEGRFEEGGRLVMSMTAGYLTGSEAMTPIVFDGVVGDDLLTGGTARATLEGFGRNYVPILSITRIADA